MAADVKAACVHHWVIESSHKGRTSPGTCIRCGEKRQFFNFIEFQLLGDRRARGGRRAGGRK